MYVNLLEMDQNQYKKLMDYIFECCDEISLCFPGVYPDGAPLDDEYWQNYHSRTKELQDYCMYRGGRKIITRTYNGMHLGYNTKVIYIKINDDLKKMIYERPLFEFLAENGLPEDISFYSKGKLRFLSCTHEDEFFVFEKTKRDEEFFKKL